MTCEDYLAAADELSDAAADAQRCGAHVAAAEMGDLARQMREAAAKAAR